MHKWTVYLCWACLYLSLCSFALSCRRKKDLHQGNISEPVIWYTMVQICFTRGKKLRFCVKCMSFLFLYGIYKHKVCICCPICILCTETKQKQMEGFVLANPCDEIFLIWSQYNNFSQENNTWLVRAKETLPIDFNSQVWLTDLHVCVCVCGCKHMNRPVQCKLITNKLCSQHIWGTSTPSSSSY